MLYHSNFPPATMFQMYSPENVTSECLLTIKHFPLFNYSHATPQVLNKDSETLRIIHSNQERVFEDEATIGDQEVNNDDVVFVVFRKGDSNDFEAISTGHKEGKQGQ